MPTRILNDSLWGRFLPLLAGTGLVAYLYWSMGWRPAMAVALGIGLGISLYHAAFGFTSAWRRFLTERWGAGLRAQIVMLALAVVLFFPTLGAGEIFGHRVGGFVAPVGTGVAVGAFIFGIGMQIAGGCASGTLFTVGGGSLRMVFTLLAFMLGGVLATFHLPFWHAQPSLGSISLLRLWGWEAALAANLLFFAMLYLLVLRAERKAPVSLGAAANTSAGAGYSLLRGPWPLIAGGVALALLNYATLASLGHPWGITSGITLWGGKLVTALGADLSEIPYWKGRAWALEGSVFRSDSSAMNIGIILGALAAAVLAGRFGKGQNMTFKGIVTALIGGLFLGYGARLAYGCNIGAFFSGVASGSLHGWLWLATGLAGNLIGVRVRRLLAL